MDATRKNRETMEFSGEEDNVLDHVHKNLLENVKQIHRKSKITPATRTEPAAVGSEFNIGSKKKTKKGGRSTHSIKKKKSRIAQKLETTKKNKTLSKPSETVYEKRAERKAGYQNVEKCRDEWTDIVSSTRVADPLVFPLKNEEIKICDLTDGGLFSSFPNLTPLEEAFKEVLSTSKTAKEEEKKLEQSKFRVSLKEMMEKQNMFASSSDSDSDEDEISSDSNESWLGGSGYREFVDSYKERKESENRLDDRLESNDESFEVDEISPSVDSSDTSESESRLEDVPHQSFTKEKTNFNEMFDSLENKLEQKLKKRLREVQEATETIPTQKKRVRRHNKRSNKIQKFAENDVTPALQTIDDAETDCKSQHRMTTSEAFADEDVVIEFQAEKQKKEKDNEPEITYPSLSRRGSWVNASNLHETKTEESKLPGKDKRFLCRIPKMSLRLDENKSGCFVIMEEDVNDKLEEHMVSKVPYPFTKGTDLKADIRAPTGRTWLPETAHQQLIAPHVGTKLGTVIEPMDEGELVRRNKTA